MERVVEMKSPAEVLGARLLSDIKKDEGSLESVCLSLLSSLFPSALHVQSIVDAVVVVDDQNGRHRLQLLTDLRKKQPTQPSKTGIPQLDDLWKHHGAPRLSIFGYGLALLYKLIHHQVRTLNGTVVLIDLAGTFSPSHLHLSRQELGHVHVFRPHRGNLKVTMDSLEEYMLWGEESAGSRAREWVSTLVNGGTGGDVNVGWRGWLRVEREGFERCSFGAGTSVEEALAERKRRLDGLMGEEGVMWKAVSEYGEFSWNRV